MKERITGIISFFGAIAIGITIFYQVSSYDAGFDDFLITGIVFIPIISTVLYVLWTKFGKKELSELEKMDLENKLLIKQIERKELKKKLEE